MPPTSPALRVGRTRPIRSLLFALAVLAAVGCEQRQPPAAAGDANAQANPAAAPTAATTRTEQDMPSHQQRLAFLQEHVVVQVPHQARQIRFTHHNTANGWSLTGSFHLPPAAFDAFAKGLRRASGSRGDTFDRRDDRRGLAETLRLRAPRHVVEIRSRSL